MPKGIGYSRSGTPVKKKSSLKRHSKKRTPKAILRKPITRRKARKVMGEFKRGSLRSSSGAKVTNRKQAIAIAISEGARAVRKRRKK